MKLSPSTKRSAIVNGAVVAAIAAILFGAGVASHLRHDSSAPVQYTFEKAATGGAAPSTPTPTPTASAPSSQAEARPAAVAPRASRTARYLAPVQQQEPAASPADSSIPATDPSAAETLPVSQGTVDQGGVTRAPSPAPPAPVTTALKG